MWPHELLLVWLLVMWPHEEELPHEVLIVWPHEVESLVMWPHEVELSHVKVELLVM